MAEVAPGHPSGETYDSSFFARLFAVEEEHFWFRTRNRVIASIMQHIVADLPNGYRVLEVGCGTGNVLQVLEQTCRNGTVVGLDQSAEGLDYARRRTSCELIEGDVRTITFDSPFDVVCLFDVLEHLPDDVYVLTELRRLVSAGGVVILTVPAFPSLWSYFDVASHHQRRYTRDGLQQTLSEAGYHVEHSTYYLTSLFPLIWLNRHLISRKDYPGSVDDRRAFELATQELRIVPVINGVLNTVLHWETWMLRRQYALPFGTSLLAVARKEHRR